MPRQPDYTIGDLEKLSTRELMVIRVECYRFKGSYSPVDSDGPRYHLKDVLAVLNTREHIPSKKEASAIRASRRRNEKKQMRY